MKRNSRYESNVIRPTTQVSFSGEVKAPHRHAASAIWWAIATLFLAFFAVATGLSTFLG